MLVPGAGSTVVPSGRPVTVCGAKLQPGARGLSGARWMTWHERGWLSRPLGGGCGPETARSGWWVRSIFG
eukprot:2640366-Prymnesium_polylepis.2